MKTSLADHKRIVEEIQSVNLISGIKKLRDWLNDNGYEGEAGCKHYGILRTTGQCMSCKKQVAEPIILDTEEALEELRKKIDTPEELAERSSADSWFGNGRERR